VTTELLARMEFSMAPLPKRYIFAMGKNLQGWDGDSDVVGWDYETTDGYLKALEERGVGLTKATWCPA